MVSVALAVATALGAGHAPIAPGTFGSAVGLLLWAIVPQRPAVQLLLATGLLIAGSWAATIAERHYHTTDPGQVVIDEVMGMIITLMMIPAGWWMAIAGFLLFRLFDVLKPYPVRQFERLPRGLGVMADDAMAGVYANLALRVVLALTSHWS
jgi:phosphatidylglycerophosphatase A